MHYQFKQAVHILGKDYHRGVHEVSEKVEYHPTFLKFVGLGLIEEASPEAKMITPEAKEEKQKKLLDKILKRQGVQASAKVAAQPKAESKPVPKEEPVKKVEAKAETSDNTDGAFVPKKHKR